MTWHDTKIVFYWTSAVAAVAETCCCFCLGVVLARRLKLPEGEFLEFLFVVGLLASIYYLFVLLLPLVPTIFVLRYFSRRAAIMTYVILWPIPGLFAVGVLRFAFQSDGEFWTEMMLWVAGLAPSIAALATLTWMTRPSKHVIREEQDSRDQS